MDLTGMKGNAKIEQLVAELDELRQPDALVRDSARAALSGLLTRMRETDPVSWLEHVVVACQAFRSDEIAAVIQAIPMEKRPMKSHSYRCKTYRGASQPFDENDECTCGYRRQRDELAAARAETQPEKVLKATFETLNTSGQSMNVYVTGKGGGHTIRMTVGEIRAGKPQLQVACVTCGVTLHEATVAPIERIMEHVNRVPPTTPRKQRAGTYNHADGKREIALPIAEPSVSIIAHAWYLAELVARLKPALANAADGNHLMIEVDTRTRFTITPASAVELIDFLEQDGGRPSSAPHQPPVVNVVRP